MTIRALQFAVGLFLVVIPGCVKGQEPPEAASYLSIDKYTVRVLLENNLTASSVKINCPYKIINVDTTEVFGIQTEGEILDIETQPDGIKAGYRIFKTKRLIIEPQRPVPLKINEQSYRGNLEFRLRDNSDSPTMMLINNVPLESYLMGVIAAEMPSYWDTEALKAQAIAARTYCLHIKSKFGQNRSWDVRATQANQVYKGVSAETVRTTNAVNATNGMILCCENEYGDCTTFGAYYSSICGGHTENAENVFGEDSPALIGAACPYCSQITRPSVFYWPMVKFDKKYISQQLFDRYPSLKELGRIEKIEVEKESVYENDEAKPFKRIVTVKLVGANRKNTDPNSPPAAAKTAILRAEDMRLAIDPTGTKIQSTSCTIVNLQNEIMFLSGRGFGHGVGLCQYGARQMAREGKTAQQILSFYYPDSRIKILY